MASNVNHPSHYNQGKIEVIDYIEEVTRNIDDGFEGGLVFNILKYVSRYPYKNGVEDLNKAQWYLNKLVKYKTGRTDKSKLEETKKSEYSFMLSGELAAKIMSDEIDINSLNGVFTNDSKKVIVDIHYLPCNNKDDILEQCKKYTWFVFVNEER